MTHIFIPINITPKYDGYSRHNPVSLEGFPSKDKQYTSKWDKSQVLDIGVNENDYLLGFDPLKLVPEPGAITKTIIQDRLSHHPEVKFVGSR